MSAPGNSDKHLWVSWDEYHRLIERLALIVHQSGWKFDKIVCLARGGVRVGDVLSRIFDVPLGILATILSICARIPDYSRFFLPILKNTPTIHA